MISPIVSLRSPPPSRPCSCRGSNGSGSLAPTPKSSDGEETRVPSPLPSPSNGSGSSISSNQTAPSTTFPRPRGSRAGSTGRRCSRALDAIVARHEALRTTFATQDGHPVQVIAAPRPVALAVLDLAAHPADDREAACQRRLAAEVQRPFDLSRDLLLRATLVRLREDEHVLLVVLHHIASDGWSLAVLYRELATLYGAFAQGHAAALPALSIQYADYAVWQRQWLQGAVLEAHLAYWRTATGRPDTAGAAHRPAAPGRADVPGGAPDAYPAPAAPCRDRGPQPPRRCAPSS